MTPEISELVRHLRERKLFFLNGAHYMQSTLPDPFLQQVADTLTSISERTDAARTKMAQESDAEFARLTGLVFDATTRALAAEARLAEAVKALDPFEDYPDWSERKGNEMTGMRITYRQLRAAHAALRIRVSGSTEGGK